MMQDVRTIEGWLLKSGYDDSEENFYAEVWIDGSLAAFRVADTERAARRRALKAARTAGQVAQCRSR